MGGRNLAQEAGQKVLPWRRELLSQGELWQERN
jgi:hypothetical protein